MSIKVKTVMTESPRAFQVFNEYYLYSGALVEHSPIYTEFTAEVNITGSYTDGSIDYAYSYTGNRTWTRIAMVGDSSFGMDKIANNAGPIDINGVFETPEASVGQVVTPGTDEFLMGLRPALDMTSVSPMFVPQYPAALFHFNGSIETSAVIGTRTDNGVSPPVITDIVQNVSVGQPTFTFLFAPTDPRHIVDVMNITGGAQFRLFATINEDLTAWSLAKWRDFRGAYTATEVDVNGITTTLDVTFA